MINKQLNRLYDPNALLNNYKNTLAPQHKSYLIRIQKSQRKLIQQTLLMIIGIESQTFKYHPQDGYTIQTVVQVKHLTPLALQNVLLFFVQFSNRIRYIQNKLQILLKKEGIILNSCLFTIKQYVRQLKSSYAQILGLHQFQSGKVDRSHTIQNLIQMQLNINQPLTLISLKVLIYKESEIVDVILTIIKKCLQNQSTKQNNQSAVLVLNLFWQILDKFQHQQITCRKAKIILKLLEAPMLKYLQFIKQWLKGQDLMDLFAQFYINNNGGQGIQSYGIRKAVGKEHFIPIFLRDFYNDIFLNGRFIKILYCFVDQRQRQQIWSYLSIEDHFKKLENILSSRKSENKKTYKKFNPSTISKKLELRKISRVKETFIEESPYSIFDKTQGVFQLTRLSRASTQVTILSQNEDTKQTEKLQFHQQGFLSQFKIIFEINLKDTLNNITKKCEQYFSFKNTFNKNQFSLLRNSVDIQLQGIKRFLLFGQGQFFQELIETLDLQLNKTLAMVSDNNIRLYLQNAFKNSNARYLQEQLIKNLFHKFLSTQGSVIGWDAFSLQYRVQYPLVLIFPKFTMQKYNSIFNFIWRLKRLESIIKRLWIQSFRNRSPHKIYLFINSLSQFSNGLLSQIMLRIEIQWNKFLENKKKLGNFYEFISLHQQFITILEMITYQTPKDKNIISQLNSIFQTALRFHNLIIYSSEQLNKSFIIEQGQKADTQLRFAVKQLLKAQQSLPKEIMDFNNHYDEL